MRRGRFVRTLTIAALSVAATLTAMLTSANAAPAPDGSFRNGHADAVATVFGIAPGVGSLSLGVNAGVAVSQVTNNLAQSEAKVLDLGLIGTSLTAQQCDGSPGSVRPDQLPQPTMVDNRSGDASKASDSYPVAGSALGGGRQSASATRTPSAHATATGIASELGPVVTISAARSDATSAVIDHRARQAEGVVTMDLDIAGVAKLSGLRWDAVHRTGNGSKIGGTFTIAGSSIGGVSVPVDQLSAVQAALNAALAPSGITIELPKVEHLSAPNELVRVTPLTVSLKDSPAGKATVGPVLNLTRTQREQMFNTIVSAYCKAASLLLVGDVTTDVISGTGFMTVTIGGAEASSGDTIEGNPFGTDGFVPPVIDSSPAATSRVGAPAASGAAPVAGAAVQPAALGPIDQVCETLHLSKHPGCSLGLGWPIGIAGVALTAAMGLFDWRRQRGIDVAKAAT
jgi:hypothetical protein